jgi:hypothetical protein
MKKYLALTLAVMFALMVTTPALAGKACVPVYTKDKGAFWVSTMLLPPLLVLNVLAGVGDVPNQGRYVKGLTCSTRAVARHAVGQRSK